MINDNEFGEPLYSYSRAQAIKDGVLVDLTPVVTIQQHWKHPLACTAAVWTILDEASKTEGQDLRGICHDVSTMAKWGFAKPAATDRVYFKVIIAGKEYTFKLHVGAGDHGEAVLTLMLPDED